MRSQMVGGKNRRAFSLVEVVVAVGVISFCRLAVLGTFSVGLKSIRNALDSGSAARSLGLVAASLRAANSADHITFTAAPPFNISWKIGDPAFTTQYFLTDNDAVTNSASAASHIVCLQVTPPALQNQPCLVVIVDAWPAAAATVNWTGSAPSVNHAAGSEALYVYVHAN